jgi:hypothetical protein
MTSCRSGASKASLTRDEVVANCVPLLFAATDDQSPATASFHLLATLTKSRALATDPALTIGAVEGSCATTARFRDDRVTRDVEWHGRTIRRDMIIAVSLRRERPAAVRVRIGSTSAAIRSAIWRSVASISSRFRWYA